MPAFFSPSQNAFFAGDFREDYEAAGSWPEDAFEVADEAFERFALNPPPAGKVRGVVNGGPAWVDAPIPVDEVTADQVDERVARLLDNAARAHGFVNFADALTYIGDEDSPDDAEIAAALRSWRAAVRAVVKVIKGAPGPYAWADVAGELPPPP